MTFFRVRMVEFAAQHNLTLEIVNVLGVKVIEVNEISSNSTVLPLSGQYQMGQAFSIESLDKTDRDEAEEKLQK